MRNVDLHVTPQSISIFGIFADDSSPRSPAGTVSRRPAELQRDRGHGRGPCRSRLTERNRDPGPGGRSIECQPCRSPSTIRTPSQKGVVKKGISVPFDMKASLGVTSDGLIRIHSESMKGFGVPVNPLLKVLRLETDDLMSRARSWHPRGRQRSAARRVQLLPPPGFTASHVGARRGRALVQTFGAGIARPISPTATAKNHIYWRGGQLAFGKLTMTETDLELVDEDPRDPFDFSVDRWNEQLVAGYSKTMADRGLRAHMPDYDDLSESQRAKGKGTGKGQRPGRRPV